MSNFTRLNTKEFERTLKSYMRLSKRDFVSAINTKAYYIARRAVVETPAVKPEEIREFIKRDDGAIIGKIINARRGKRGEKGLYGKEMAQMVATVRAARLRSRAFIKSGWLWAVKTLAPHAEKIGQPRITGPKAKTIGRAKGSAVPARNGWKITAKIINTVTAAWDKREGAAKYAVPALQRAFDFETKSMKDYIARKLTQRAKKEGIRTR